MKIKAILGGLVPITALSSVAAFPALAQNTVTLEEVVVTAQRRQQNLQDVPISVSAYSGDFLEKANIRSATEYLSLTPNVSFTEDGQTGSRGLGISIRGVNNLVSGENAFINSIGVYLDEFSIASVPNQVANPQLPDMERVEVLRGPQGTYFGRNSVGGALNLTTKKPTDEFEGSISAGFEDIDGSGSQYSVTGILNVPVSDSFAMRGVLFYEDSDGYVENACAAGASTTSCPAAAANGFTPNGADGSERDALMFRLNTQWDISDRTRVSTTFIYGEDDQGTDENVPSGRLDLDSIDTFGITQALDPGTGFYPNNRNKLSHDLDEHTQNESSVAILNIEHEISDTLTLKSVTGFIDAELDRFFDNDLVGGFDALRRINLYEGFSWSTELRLEWSTDKNDLILGLLYAEDDQEQQNSVEVSSQPTANFNGVGVLPPFPEGLGLARNNKNFEVESFALFADYTARLNDHWEFTFGARYTKDDVLNELEGFGIRPDGGGPPTFINFARAPASGSESFTNVSPRLVVRYLINDDHNMYFTWSEGYKAGGTSVGNDPSAAGANGPISVPYNEETLTNLEVGYKGEFSEGRVRLNASIFHLEWDDMQFESFRFLVPGDLSSNFEQTINIAGAEASGAEFELLAAVTEGLTISASAGYLDTEITSNTTAEITGGFVVNLQGLEIPKSPELTASFAAEYRMPISAFGANEWWARAEFIHRDGQYSDIEGLTNRQTNGPSPNSGLARNSPDEFPYLSPDYDVINVRVGFDAERYSVSAYIQNVGDEEYYTGTQENFGVSGIRLRPHPRIMGLSATLRF